MQNKPNQTQMPASGAKFEVLSSKSEKAERRESFGYYADEIEAAKACDRAAKKYRGEYAFLNFPPHVLQPCGHRINNFIIESLGIFLVRRELT